MRLPAIPKALLRLDPVVLSRPATAADANGDDTMPRTLVASVTAGTYTAPTALDQVQAGQRETQVDAVVVFVPGADVQDGDLMTIRGGKFDVVAVEDRRNRIRVHIRKVTV